jgi:HPt (histidine-containing phosphotransfer) domain-containing protein
MALGINARHSHPPRMIEIHFHEAVMKSSSDCWDQTRALEGVGGDSEFLNELVEIFCAACPTLLDSLEDSIAARRFFSAADTAHMLGRAARNLAATGVMETALTVEMMARGKEFDDIDNAFRVLRQEAGRLLDALANFRLGRPGFPDS